MKRLGFTSVVHPTFCGKTAVAVESSLPNRRTLALATFSYVERCGKGMRGQRKIEIPEERRERLTREAQMKKDDAAAEEAAVDRMIRLNIQQFGP
jgi:hypothetical protein